jgi:hypothetical protein
VPDRLWLAAGAATIVAGAVVGIALFGNRPGKASVTDPRGDVVGKAPAAVARDLDLSGARIERDGTGYRATFEFYDRLDRDALAAEPARYELSMQGHSKSFLLRVYVGNARAEARVIGPVGTPPYVTAAPSIGARQIAVTFPDKAVQGLGPRFTWGASAQAAGSIDTAPVDRSARFPS